MGRAGVCGPRGVAQGGRERLPVHDDARGIRGRGSRQALCRGANGGTGARRLHRDRLRAAQRDRRPVHPPLRNTGAEAALPAEAGQRRDDRRDRHERAGCGQRSAGDQEHGHPAEGRQLPAQRQQDVHHQRLACGPGDRRREDRSRRGGQGHESAAGRTHHALDGLRGAPGRGGPRHQHEHGEREAAGSLRRRAAHCRSHPPATAYRPSMVPTKPPATFVLSTVPSTRSIKSVHWPGSVP